MAEIAELRSFEPVAEHAAWTRAGLVVSHMPDNEVTALEERSIATMGDPTTLGWWGFATGTWIVATILGGMLPHAGFTAVAPLLLIFAGIAQFIAGLYAYRRVDALMATAFCCFGALYATLAVLLMMQAGGALPASATAMVLTGYLLESFAFIALALMVAALRSNVATVALLGTLCVGFVLTGIASFIATTPAAGVPVVGTIGAAFMLASALCAYYIGMAHIVNSMWKRTVLPMLEMA
jgi:succinate-acetate transporter protein